MSIKEDREYLAAVKAERKALKENAEKQAREDFNNAVIAREDLKAAHEAKIDRFYEYKDNVKKTLVVEFLTNLYEKSMHNPSERELSVGKAMIGNYVNEIGATQLIKNMKASKSGLLMEVADEIEAFYSKITDGSNAEEVETQTIKPEDLDAFWKKIDKAEDVVDMTDLIRLRVANAEEEFVNRNMEDKENVKTILKQTAERVQNAKEGNDNDYAEQIEESETRLAKDQIYQVQHEAKHNVFDRMVRNLAEAVLGDENAKKEFILENGRLNMDKIVESARCMYTLLEMVSCTKLEKVDQQYIEDTLKSIK